MKFCLAEARREVVREHLRQSEVIPLAVRHPANLATPNEKNKKKKKTFLSFIKEVEEKREGK
jgi:hypothetical protein